MYSPCSWNIALDVGSLSEGIGVDEGLVTSVPAVSSLSSGRLGCSDGRHEDSMRLVSSDEREETRRRNNSAMELAWRSYLGSRNIDYDLDPALSIMYRVASWGTALPMSSPELGIHMDVMRGLRLSPESIDYTTRPCFSFGIWSLTESTALSVSMLVPALVTSSITVPDSFLTYYNAARRSIQKELPSSAGTDGLAKRSAYNGTTRIVGRLASSVVAYMEGVSVESSLEFNPEPTFCHLSSSALVFKLMHKGAITKYGFGKYTAMFVHSVMDPRFRAVYDDMTGVIVFVEYMLPPGRGPGAGSAYVRSNRIDKSKLVISVEGNVRFQGSPSLVQEAYSTLCDILHGVMLNTNNVHKLLKTLVT
jgi:hypothetical protein